MVQSVYQSEMAEIIEMIESIADPLNVFNLFLSFISIFINILHFIILTRSSMKSSSTNVIMIGIAIVDIFTLSLTVAKHISLVDIENNECVSSNSHWKVYVDLFIWGLQDYFRRCSTWLGLLMAMIRTMIVKNMLGTQNPCLTRQKCGWLVVFTIVILASTLSIFWNFRFKIIENRTDNMPISCEEFQDIHKPPRFTLGLVSLFTMNDKIVSKAYLMVDAILSKFIPCILFPILTILLIRALRRAKKARSHSKTANQNDHTTKLVIFMTVAFFVAEAPLGVIYMINAFYHTNDGLIIASVDVIIVFACLLTINSTCHFFFCICLSRQYRSTIYYTFRLDKLVVSNTIQNAETRNMSSIAAPSIRLISVH